MSGSTPWVFGIVRASGTLQPSAGWMDFGEAASRCLGRTVEVRAFPTYAALAEALRDGTCALAWAPPLLAIALEDEGAIVPLALPDRRGQVTYFAVFVTARGGGRTLGALRGTRVAWVDRDSAAGYVVPRRHLEREGLDPDRYFSSELFLQSHYAVVDAVASGRVDAGATFCTLDPTTGTVLTAGWTDAEGAVLRPMQPVVRMGPIPNDTVVASRSLVEAERAAVLQWLLQPDVPSQRAAFEALRASSFRAVSPEHYGPLRRLCAR